MHCFAMSLLADKWISGKQMSPGTIEVHTIPLLGNCIIVTGKKKAMLNPCLIREESPAVKCMRHFWKMFDVMSKKDNS